MNKEPKTQYDPAKYSSCQFRNHYGTLMSEVKCLTTGYAIKTNEIEEGELTVFAIGILVGRLQAAQTKVIG